MNRPTRRFTPAAVAAALTLAMTLGACGDDDTSTSGEAEPAGPTTETTDSTDEQTGDELVISGAWARTSPSMATAGAVYLIVENPTDADDALVSAAVAPEVAATVELHESRMADDEMDDDGMDDADDDEMDDDGMDDADDDGMDGDSGGMMTMTPVDRIPVPANGAATLEPGGFHIMLLDLAAPLEVGTTIEVTLTFENAGELVVTADVRDSAP